MSVTDQAVHQCPETTDHVHGAVQCWRHLGHGGIHRADCDQCAAIFSSDDLGDVVWTSAP